MLLLIAAFLTLTASKVFASRIIEVEKNHLYTWEEKRDDETSLFYGLELGMTDERAGLWENYYQEVTRAAKGYFRGLVNHEVSPDGLKENIESSFKERLYAALAKRANAIGMQISSFAVGPSGQSRGENIAYICRKPIRGRMELSPKRGLTLQELYDHFNDIVMTVWVNPYGDGSLAYQNRGIIRSPFSMLFDEYKGLSIKIHAFTALVMENLYGSQFLHVRAAAPMTKLLVSAFKREEIFYGPLGWPPQLSDFAETLPEDFSLDGFYTYGCPRVGDTPLSFKTETLKKKLLEEDSQGKPLEDEVRPAKLSRKRKEREEREWGQPRHKKVKKSPETDSASPI